MRHEIKLPKIKRWDGAWKDGSYVLKKEVKSCPCCGSDDLRIAATQSCTYGVKCRECGLSMEAEWPWLNKSKKAMTELQNMSICEAIKKWNRRVSHGEK